MPASVSVSDRAAEALAFADSVAGVLDRHARADEEWAPGVQAPQLRPELTAALDELGWEALAHDPGLVAYAGLGAVELGRRLAPVQHVDRLLGASPTVGNLVRSLLPERKALVHDGGSIVVGAVTRSEPIASADGVDVHRVLELGASTPINTGRWASVTRAWTAASLGYLGGLGRGALDLTVGYVRQRRAFGSTLGAMAPVQQLLAEAATAVRGVQLLAAEDPDGDALAYAGPAIAHACAACHQATGAIGFTLEYPLHRYTQRARALDAWNCVLLESLIVDQPSAMAR